MTKEIVYARRDVGNVLLELLDSYEVSIKVPKCCASMYTVLNGFGPELCLQYAKRLANIIHEGSELRQYEHNERIGKRFIELLIRKSVRNCLLDTPTSVSYTLLPHLPEKESSDAVETWELSTSDISEHSERDETGETSRTGDSDSDAESWNAQASFDESQER